MAYYGALISDLLWADPTTDEQGHTDYEYVVNKNRGCSVVFGRHAVTNLLNNNDLMSVLRGHEVQYEGFKFYDWLDQGFPQVINVFSAANYCDKYNNKGSIITLDVS